MNCCDGFLEALFESELAHKTDDTIPGRSKKATEQSVESDAAPQSNDNLGSWKTVPVRSIKDRDQVMDSIWKIRPRTRTPATKSVPAPVLFILQPRGVGAIATPSCFQLRTMH
jgi:hypothetical protein